MNSAVDHQLIAALRARLERRSSVQVLHEEIVATGSFEIDNRLGGGLPRAAVHEVFAETAGDTCAASAFALLLAIRASPTGPLVWLREDRGLREGGPLHAPGLMELGVDPAVIVSVTAPDTLALLRAGADVVGCAAVGTLILEPWGRAPPLDLTASRRLALAAARSGVMAIVLRSGIEPVPSAARTRWRVAAAPSKALGASAPGMPAFGIGLLRHRGGIAGFDTRVEWDRDQASFRDAAVSGRVPAVVAGRTRDQGERRAA